MQPPERYCTPSDPLCQRRSHDPGTDLMTGMTPELYRENMVTLFVMDALVGELTYNVRALFLEFQADDIVAHFLLRGPSPEDENEILEEFPFGLAALTHNIPGVGVAEVTPVIHYDGEGPTRPPGRAVFSFK